MTRARAASILLRRRSGDRLALTLLAGLCLAAPSAVTAQGTQPDCTTHQPGTPGPDAVFATWMDVDYTGPSVEAHCGQRYNVFVPPGAVMPAEGWPVLVVFNLGGFRDSKRFAFIDPDVGQHQRVAIAHEALTDPLMPMAVVFASGTVSRGGGSGNAVDDSVYDPWAGPPRYGPAYPGNGVFIPPEAIPPQYSGALEPYIDPVRPMAEKDVVMLMQHVKHNADAFPPGVGASAIKLDTSRVVLYGDSAGAIASMWVALGPDRSEKTFPNPVPGSQEELDPRPGAAVLHAGTVFFPRLVQDSVLQGTVTGVHLPVTANGAGTYYDVPGTVLSDNTIYQHAGSALVYGLDGQSTELAEANSRLPLLLSYTDGSTQPAPLCFDIDPMSGAPAACAFATGLEQNVHSSWHGHVWKLRHPNTFLVTTLDAAYDRQGEQLTDPLQINRVPDLVLPDTTNLVEMAAVQMDWIVAQMYGPAGTWNDLGFATDGTYGKPRLDAYGSLRPLTPIALCHSNALDNAPVGIIIGYSAVNLPFLSGTLVPMPDLIHFDVPYTSNLGRLVVSAIWPPGFDPGTTIYFQTFVWDPGAPFGWASTNAMAAITP